MAPEIALTALEPRTAGRTQTVLDPMCGSGTVIAAAARLGYAVVGLDVDPLAVLMSRVATTQVPKKAVLDAAKICLDSARKSRRRTPPWEDRETGRFAAYWFGAGQQLQLARLAWQIRGVQDEDVRNVLHVAMSRLIITKTPQASLAADTAHSRPHKVVEYSNYDVFRGFEISSEKLAQVVSSLPKGKQVNIRMGDARSQAELPTGKFDLTITSPPYLNAIDYLRGHRLSLIWMGYSIPELREIRRASIGTEFGLWSDSDVEDQLIDDLIGSRSDIPRPLLRRYLKDVRALASNLYRATKEGGLVVTVVADSTLKGTLIPTGALVRECLSLAGFRISTVSVRDIPESKRYLPVRNAGVRLGGRMKQEHILHSEKAS